MRVVHSMVICEKPASKRPRTQSSLLTSSHMKKNTEKKTFNYLNFLAHEEEQKEEKKSHMKKNTRKEDI